MTLLERAIAAKRGAYRCQRPTAEELDLALAYFMGQLTTSQVGRAIGCSDGCVPARMTPILRNAMRLGMVKVEVVK